MESLEEIEKYTGLAIPCPEEVLKRPSLYCAKTVLKSVKTLRRQKRLSQWRVAAILGISESTYAKMEEGRESISRSVWECLMGVYGVYGEPWEHIVGGSIITRNKKHISDCRKRTGTKPIFLCQRKKAEE
jgi:DNA-binding XRE family transcriptional regulator